MNAVTFDLAELVRLVATGVVTVGGFLLAQAYKNFNKQHDQNTKDIASLNTRVAVLEAVHNAEHS